MQADIKAPKPCTCGRVCFWLLWVLLFFTLILGAVALALYFVYQPQVRGGKGPLHGNGSLSRACTGSLHNEQ